MRIYSGTLHLRDVIRISEKEKIKITEMCVRQTVNYIHPIQPALVIL